MLAFWRRYVMAQEFEDPAGWELQNMLTIATLMTSCAREREESRGVHYRRDFPERDDEHWCRHIEVKRSE
jgi:L-aspartate oxidase